MEISLGKFNFKVDAGKHPIYWEHINSGDWEKSTFKAIDAFIETDDTAMDIGAWAGPISFYLAHKCQNVYAIEPDPAIFPDLEKNIQLNPKLKIKAFPFAIADQSTTLNLHARKAYGQSSSSLLSRSKDSLSSSRIESKSLIDFLDQNNIQKVDFIKIDTEGGEFIFLKQWNQALQKLNHPTLLISFHLNHLKESVFLKHLKNKYLSRLILKLCELFSISLFHSDLKKELETIKNSLKSYAYTYDLDGNQVDFSQLAKSPKSIGNNSFVFSNKRWND